MTKALLRFNTRAFLSVKKHRNYRLFFLGQATGPVLYGFGLTHMGSLPTLAIAAAIMALLGIVCARLLGGRPDAG